MRGLPVQRRSGKIGIWIVLLIAAAACLVFHAPLLRWAAEPLVADEVEEGADWICLRSDDGLQPGGDRCYDVAAQLCLARRGRAVLLLEPRSPRSVACGAMPSFEAISRRELAKRQVPAADVHLIPGKTWNEWDQARALGAWLADRPQAVVLVLEDRFGSRARRQVFDATLSPDVARRIRVAGLADRRFDETNWWRSRDGIKAFMFAWLERLFHACQGEDRSAAPPLDPDQYERAFVETLRKGAS